MLLCLLQIVPIFLYLISWYLRCRLHITLLNGSGRMYRGQAHTVILSVEQKGILPIGSATATLVCTNLLSGQSEQMRLCFPIPARNTVQIAVQVIPEHCGMTQIQLAELQIWDYMRLWSRKIRRSAVFTTPAYPMGSPCFAALSNLQTQLTPESNTATSQTIGQDTSELYGIRSYQPGDRMNRIHWKLSSRQDGLLVKEYGTLLQETLQIVLVLPNGVPEKQTVPPFSSWMLYWKPSAPFPIGCFRHLFRTPYSFTTHRNMQRYAVPSPTQNSFGTVCIKYSIAFPLPVRSICWNAACSKFSRAAVLLGY